MARSNLKWISILIHWFLTNAPFIIQMQWIWEEFKPKCCYLSIRFVYMIQKVKFEHKLKFHIFLNWLFPNYFFFWFWYFQWIGLFSEIYMVNRSKTLRMHFFFCIKWLSIFISEEWEINSNSDLKFERAIVFSKHYLWNIILYGTHPSI